MRVLIVDDNRMALTILKHALVSGGYEVDTASNGREALEIVRSGVSRFVITDWEMPEMDGIELCRAIRALDTPGYVYIVLLTGHDAPHEKVAGLSAGADDFITQPFDAAEVLARVHAGERILSMETREGAIV